MSWVTASLIVYIVALDLSIGIMLIINWFSKFLPEIQFVSSMRKNILGFLCVVLFLVLILSFWSFIYQKSLSHVPLHIIMLLLNVVGLVALSTILRIKWKFIVLWKKIIFLLWIFVFLPLTSALLFLAWVIGGRGMD